MSEIMGQGNEGVVPVNADLGKALVAKTVDNLEATRENGELIRANTEMVKGNAELIRGNAELINRNAELIKKIPDPSLKIQAVGKTMESVLAEVVFLKPDIKEIKDFLHDFKKDVLKPGDLEAFYEKLDQHAELFEKPLKRTIHHTHLLGKPMWILGGMGVVVLFLLFGLERVWETSALHAENDLKWRYIVQTHDSTVLKHVQETEDNYKSSADAFRQAVEDEEDRRKKYFEKMMLDSKTQDEMRELDQKEKRH